MPGIAIKILGANFSASGLGHVTLKGAAVPVTAIAINGSNSITNSGQYTAVLTPSNTTQTRVVWSITSGGTYASIDQNGVVTAKSGANNSSVTIKCTSADNSSIYGTKTIRVSYVNAITGIAISGPSSVSGSGQFTAALTPSDTTQTGVVWSITSGGTYASIDQNGMVTAKSGASNSSVTIKCQSSANSSVYATKTISVTYSVPITGLNIDGPTAVTDSAQFTPLFTPTDTTQKGVVWGISAGSQYATIDQTGLVTALDGANANLVTITCTSAANSSIVATKNLSVTKSSEQPASGLVTDGLVRNFDAKNGMQESTYNNTPTVILTDTVDSAVQATFYGTPQKTSITINTAKDGNENQGLQWEKMLHGQSAWTLEYVMYNPGWADSANASADIYHDVSSEFNCKHVIYLGPSSSPTTQHGTVLTRYSRQWKSAEWVFEDSNAIDWSVPHVIHVTRESAETGMSFKLYLDGALFATATTTQAGNGTTYANKVVFLAAKGERHLYAIRAYSKALTPAEVLQNTNYNIERYNLQID